VPRVLRFKQVRDAEGVVHRTWKAPFAKFKGRTACDVPFYIRPVEDKTQRWKWSDSDFITACRPARAPVNCLACIGSPLHHEDDVQA
jgi:hypothetical protein